MSGGPKKAIVDILKFLKKISTVDGCGIYITAEDMRENFALVRACLVIIYGDIGENRTVVKKDLTN